MTKLDKRDRAALFRDRLSQAMEADHVSQSALARGIGVDRSTVSQLLSPGDARLPNAQVVGECAGFLKVSADWLLGLSERPESAADLVANSLSVTAAARALVDEQIFAWHRETDGYKIRHVPATLPDMLKTQAMLEWEYRPHLGRTTEQAIGASQDRLDFLLSSQSDYEIALPVFELTSFAEAEGYYSGLPQTLIDEQIDRLQELSETLYPRLRLHLFDARRVYSAPITVFGPQLAVIYLGQSYLCFRDKDRVRTLTQHFDQLVRAASVSDRAFPEHLAGLRRTSA